MTPPSARVACDAVWEGDRPSPKGESNTHRVGGTESLRAALPHNHVEDLIDAAQGDRHFRHEDATLDGVKKRVVGPIAAVGVPCTCSVKVWEKNPRHHFIGKRPVFTSVDVFLSSYHTR